MFSHVSDVPCLPLSSYRASLDGEAHISPAAFEQCASAIVSAYRSHYAECSLTTAQAEEDAGDFILSVLDAIPQPIRDAAGFPGQNSPAVATDATADEPTEASADQLHINALDRWIADPTRSADQRAALIETRAAVIKKRDAARVYTDADMAETEAMHDLAAAMVDQFNAAQAEPETDEEPVTARIATRADGFIDPVCYQFVTNQRRLLFAAKSYGIRPDGQPDLFNFDDKRTQTDEEWQAVQNFLNKPSRAAALKRYNAEWRRVNRGKRSTAHLERCAIDANNA